MRNANLEVKILESGDDVGRYVANLIVTGLKLARNENRDFVLGCPSGRTPRSTLKALTEIVTEQQIDLSNLVVVMMDG